MHRRTLVSAIVMSALFVALHESAAVDVKVAGNRYRVFARDGKVVVADAIGKATSLPASIDAAIAPDGKGLLVSAKAAPARLSALVHSRKSVNARRSTILVSVDLAKGQSVAVDEGARQVGLITKDAGVAGDVVWQPKGLGRPVRVSLRLNPNTEVVLRSGSLIVAQSAGQTTVMLSGLQFVVENAATLELAADAAGRLRVRQQSAVGGGRIRMLQASGGGAAESVPGVWLTIGGEFPPFDKPYYVTGGTSPSH